MTINKEDLLDMPHGQWQRLFWHVGNHVTNAQMWDIREGREEIMLECIFSYDSGRYIREKVAEEIGAKSHAEILEEASECDPDVVADLFGGWDGLAKMLTDTKFKMPEGGQ